MDCRPGHPNIPEKPLPSIGAVVGSGSSYQQSVRDGRCHLS